MVMGIVIAVVIGIGIGIVIVIMKNPFVEKNKLKRILTLIKTVVMYITQRMKIVFQPLQSIRRGPFKIVLMVKYYVYHEI